MNYNLKEEVAASAENSFTDPISPTRETPKSNKGYGYLNVSVAGTFTATVSLQRRFVGESSWRNVKTYSEATEEDITDLEYGVEYRIGVDTGDYTDGTANCRLGRAN